ncbi:MAG TPA: hypothetical protein VFB31_09275 [Pseudolabrys sp.]|nr:hypothetical protein [Pseudolabrys sp.]
MSRKKQDTSGKSELGQETNIEMEALYKKPDGLENSEGSWILGRRWQGPEMAELSRRVFEKYAFVAEVSMPLLAIVIFIIDKWLAQVLYAFGYDETATPHLGFVRRQYEFISGRFPSADVKLYDFHLFEMIVWLVLATTCLRIVAGLCPLRNFDARAVLKKKNRSPLAGFLSWVLITGYVLYLSLVTPEHFAGPITLQALAQYSPRTFIAFEVFVFCCSALVFAEGFIFSVYFVIGPRTKSYQ